MRNPLLLKHREQKIQIRIQPIPAQHAPQLAASEAGSNRIPIGNCNAPTLSRSTQVLPDAPNRTHLSTLPGGRQRILRQAEIHIRATAIAKRCRARVREIHHASDQDDVIPASTT